MISARGIAALALLGVLPIFAASPDAEADPLLKRLQARLAALETLKGRFAQSLDARSLGQPRTEHGSFAMKKPSKMRWEYEEPERKLAITDGVTTWLYVPEDREVYRGSLGSLEEGGSTMLLLTGQIRLDRDFRSRRLSSEEAGPQGVVGAEVLELKPRKPSPEFEKLVLAIDPGPPTIRRLTIIDPLGDKMVFDFFDIDENVPLADELFRFEIPAGVEVIDQR